MEPSWVNGRLAVGPAAVSMEEAEALRRAGITHVIDLRDGVEPEPTALAEAVGLALCWLPCPDDFQPKPPELLERGVRFALDALAGQGQRVYACCTAGVHRGPLMMLAILRALGWGTEEAAAMIKRARPLAEFPQSYLDSVEEWAGRYGW